MLFHDSEIITPAKAWFDLSTRSKIPKHNPPKEERGPSNQEWEHFRGSWRRHTKYWGLVQEKELVYNLWQSLSWELIRTAIYNGMNCKEFNTKLAKLGKIIVKGQSTMVDRVKFSNLYQKRNESIHSFVEPEDFG